MNSTCAVFGRSIRICLFHITKPRGAPFRGLGWLGVTTIRAFQKLHVWIRLLFAHPLLQEDAIHSNFDVLFERESFHGPIHVEDECLDASKKLVRYYKTFWLTRVPMKMWCNNTTRERTNNLRDGFRNGLRNSTPLAYPNPFIPIELLRKVERETTARFKQYLRGDDTTGHSRRREDLEGKIFRAVERYKSLQLIVTPRQFFGPCRDCVFSFTRMKI